MVSHDLDAFRAPVDAPAHNRPFDPDAYLRTEDFAAALTDSSTWDIEVDEKRPRPAGAASASHHIEDVVALGGAPADLSAKSRAQLPQHGRCHVTIRAVRLGIPRLGFKGACLRERSDRADRQRDGRRMFGVVENLLIGGLRRLSLADRLAGAQVAGEQRVGATGYLQPDSLTGSEGDGGGPHVDAHVPRPVRTGGSVLGARRR